MPAWGQYGPETETSCTTTGDFIENSASAIESAVEGNTNSVILIRGGTYSLNNFTVGDGNTVRPYDCESVRLNFSATNTWDADNITVRGLTLDWGNLNSGGFRFSSGSTNNLIQGNYIQGEQPFELIGNVQNVTFRANELEGCPNCNLPEGVKLDDSGSDGPCNILVEDNDFMGTPPEWNQFDIHDMVQAEGVGNCGTLQSELNPGLGNFSVVFRGNRFRSQAGGAAGENFFDIKIGNGGLADQGRILWEQNYFLGPLYGNPNDENTGNCVNIGDQDCAAGATNCKQHVLTHNLFVDCMAPDEEPSDAKRSEAISGGSRYSTVLAEFNAINNRERLDQGQWTNQTRVVLRHNSYFWDTARYQGNSCSDSVGTGFVLSLHRNVYSGSRVDSSCSGGGDWDIRDNMFYQTLGNNFEARWDGVGNVDNVNPQYANVSNNGSGGVNNDFTILNTGTNPSGIKYNHLGAFPSPVLGSASIDDTCTMIINFSNAPTVSEFGYDHLPMSAIDSTKINVKYDGIGPQTIQSTQAQGDTVRLNMSVCPASDDTVTFDATYGWCRDGAHIGDGINIDLSAGCLAVSGQAVANNTTGGGGDPPPPGDTTPPVVEITEPAGT